MEINRIFNNIVSSYFYVYYWINYILVIKKKLVHQESLKPVFRSTLTIWDCVGIHVDNSQWLLGSLKTGIKCGYYRLLKYKISLVHISYFNAALYHL